MLEVKSFEITAKQREYNLSVLTVNEDDTVKITVTNIDVTRNFYVSSFNINERLEPKKTVEIVLVVNEKGEYQFERSIFCGSGHVVMNGLLMVK